MSDIGNKVYSLGELKIPLESHHHPQLPTHKESSSPYSLSCIPVVPSSITLSFSHPRYFQTFLIFWVLLIMDVSTSFDSAGSSSWSSLVPLRESAYSRDYAGSLDARHFQASSTRGDSYFVYNSRRSVHRETRESMWIRRWAHRVGLGAVLRQKNAPWLDMRFMRCTEDRGYIVRVAEIVA